MKNKLSDYGVSGDDNSKEYENLTGVEWLESMISSMILNGGDSDLLSVLTHCKKAKQMEEQDKISLLEWIRDNAVELEGGWQYVGETYTDKQIIGVYKKLNENLKTK